MGIPVSGKNLFPSNIQGLPDLVRDPRQQDGLHGARPRLRPHGRDERADLRARHRRGRARRLRALRLLVAARPRPRPRRRHTSSACRSPQLCVETFEKPRERMLMKNIGYVGAARGARSASTSRSSPTLLDEKFARNERAARLEPAGDALGLRLRARALRLPAAVPPRGDGREPGLDPHRRQHRHRARLPSTPARRSRPGTRSRRRPR